MQNNPYQHLIDELGEDSAKAYLRDYFARPENIPAFAMIFEKHVPEYPPDFHVDIWETYTSTPGNVGGAAPRGFAKSTITSLVYLAWRMLNASSRFSVLISDTYTQAVDLGAGLKDELEENEFIRWLYGNVMGDAWAEDDIIVWGLDAGGKRLECRLIMLGAGMKVRGRKFKNFRPQLVIVDDLENDEAVESKPRRAKLRRWLVKAVLPAVDRQVGRVILIGTILHKRSLLSGIINHEDEFKSWTTFFYAGIMENQSIWPELYSTTEIYEWRDNPANANYLGAVSWAQEIQNNPLDEGMQIIQTAWLEGGYALTEAIERFMPLVARDDGTVPPNVDVLGEWLRYHFKLIHAGVDPAISEKETADYWAMVTIGFTKRCPICPGAPAGHIVILDILEMRESDPMVQVDAIIANHDLWQHDRIRIEAVAYQAGLVKLVRREAAKLGKYLPLKPFRPLVSKIRRMNVHSANFSGGLVHLRTDHPLYQRFKDQLTEFPQGENDDMIDGYMSAADVSLKHRGRGTDQAGTKDD